MGSAKLHCCSWSWVGNRSAPEQVRAHALVARDHEQEQALIRVPPACCTPDDTQRLPAPMDVKGGGVTAAARQLSSTMIRCQPYSRCQTSF